MIAVRGLWRVRVRWKMQLPRINNTLQHTATHCNALQHTATDSSCAMEDATAEDSFATAALEQPMTHDLCCALQCVTVCDSVLQCAAVCCSV